ncbi:hypothetical protein [Zoogloea sp.]|uniref:hypothetical protein n=1 Tax=Zoogloea sp. TaxID=49181 RepID=UPI0035ADA082
MNKNIIALALAGLAVAPTIAQAQVTIFGTADAGYRWSGHNIDPSVGSRSRIDSGTSVPSRLGESCNDCLSAVVVGGQGSCFGTHAQSISLTMRTR